MTIGGTAGVQVGEQLAEGLFIRSHVHGFLSITQGCNTVADTGIGAGTPVIPGGLAVIYLIKPLDSLLVSAGQDVLGRLFQLRIVFGICSTLITLARTAKQILKTETEAEWVRR